MSGCDTFRYSTCLRVKVCLCTYKSQRVQLMLKQELSLGLYKSLGNSEAISSAS